MNSVKGSNEHFWRRFVLNRRSDRRAKAGRIFILVDDENRENEGDLCIPAENATPEVINFMAKYARGLICLAMQRSRVEQLGCR